MPFDDALSGIDCKVVPRLDALFWLDFNVCIDNNQVAHLARTQFMNAENAGCFQNRFANRLNFFIVSRTIHQVVQGIPAKRPAHFANHESDD